MVEPEQAEMIRRFGVNSNLVVGCRSERIDPRLEPVKSYQGEPSIGRGNFVLALGAPALELVSPCRLAW
jgi:hypothetical protein